MNSNFDLPFPEVKDLDPEELIAIIRSLPRSASITVVVTAEGYTEILDGVNPKHILYSNDNICIMGVTIPYSLTIKAPDTITAADVTPQSPTYQGMDWQFNIEGDAVTVAIMVHFEASK